MTCNFCPETFNQFQTFYDHANNAHAEEIKENWVPCDQCHLRIPGDEVARLLCTCLQFVLLYALA